MLNFGFTRPPPRALRGSLGFTFLRVEARSLIARARDTRALRAALPEWALIAAAAVAPAVATYVLVHLRLDGELRDFVPHVWNDQTGYWHYVLSFSEVGFDTGYYTPNERPAAADFVRYDVHGPAFQVLMGTLARVVGWSLSTSIFINMAMIGLALAVFGRMARLDRGQIALTALVALTFWPLLLYVPTSSQESFHQAVAIVLAVVFGSLIARREPLSRRARLAIAGLILIASLVRFSWALLFLPFLVLAAPRRTLPAMLVALAASGVAGAAVLVVVSAVSAPGGNSALAALGDLSEGPFSALGDIAASSYDNFTAFADVRGLEAADVQNLQIAALLLVALGAGVVAYRRRRDSGPQEAGATLEEALFHCLNLGLVLVASIVFYLPDGYYRVMGAHLLLSLLVMVKRRRIVLVGAVVATNVLTIPSFLGMYEQWQPNFGFEPSVVAQDRRELARHVRYDADAPSPWCNTLLIPVALYDARVTLVPAGIGISYTLSQADAPRRRIRSRYVLLQDADQDLAPLVKPGRLEPVAAFPFGRLFRNPEARCESGPR